MSDRPDHVSIGLVSNAVVTQGGFVSFDDVELPQSSAPTAYFHPEVKNRITSVDEAHAVAVAWVLASVPGSERDQSAS